MKKSRPITDGSSVFEPSSARGRYRDAIFSHHLLEDRGYLSQELGLEVLLPNFSELKRYTL